MRAYSAHAERKDSGLLARQQKALVEHQRPTERYLNLIVGVDGHSAGFAQPRSAAGRLETTTPQE